LPLWPSSDTDLDEAECDGGAPEEEEEYEAGGAADDDEEEADLGYGGTG
jgi:hypothetical protein